LYINQFLLKISANDKVYQLLAQCRWFSPASSTTKTGRYDIAEILLVVALNTKIKIHLKISNLYVVFAGLKSQTISIERSASLRWRFMAARTFFNVFL
jgi:hypothetical protein